MERRPRDGGVGDAEETMALYDAWWFHRLVLLPPPHAAAAAAAPPALALSPTSPESRGEELQRAPSTSGLRHRRSRSDEASVDGLEPLKVPNGHRARLETILSGKDGLAPSPLPQPLPERRRPEVRRPGRRHRRRRGRSLSELEFEEVKGLQDLGFTFSEEEVDAELASIVPGLRRRRAEEEEAKRALAAAEEEEARRRRTAEAASAVPRRPYLSEAWDEEEEEVKRMLRNWRIPPAGDGAVLKEHLRLWAHTVASAVQ